MMKNNRQSAGQKITRAVFTLALAGAFTLPLLGCNEDVPVAEPFDAAPVVTTREPVETLDAETKEAVILGGRLYDNWFDVSGVSAPAVDNPMAKFIEGYSATAPAAPYTDFIALDGAELEKQKQYRCKTCHGFEYAGSEFVPVGIMDAADNMTLEEIQSVIKDGFKLSFGNETATKDVLVHNFGAAGLTEAEIIHLASFIKYGVVNVEEYFYPFSAKGTAIGKGDSAKGKVLFNVTVGCASGGCHGATGTARDFDDGDPATLPNEFVGTIGQEDPAEMLHKIRFGQPSEPRNGMPSIYDKELTTQDAVDIMTYTQQLPAE